MFHDAFTHEVVVWYEDFVVAAVFTLWAFDWFVEKYKEFKKWRQKHGPDETKQAPLVRVHGANDGN